MLPKKLVISTVGVSILLNILEKSEDEWRSKINNATNANQLTEDMLKKVQELSQRSTITLAQNNIPQNRKLSAELNGLYGIYNNQITTAQRDMFFLIGTDTEIGKKAIEIIHKFLKEQGLTVEIFIPSQLSSANKKTFSHGIKDLIRWCEEVIPGYQEQKYEIVFNLTGGFKSLQGYMNIVGMFYADNIAYIFETSEQVLSIPRLPIQVDKENLRKNRLELAMMSQGHVYPSEQVRDIPEGLLETDGTEVMISDWGLLVWNRVRKELLTDELLPFPRIQYEDSFRRDFRDTSANQKIDLQETLAKISTSLISRNGDTSILKQDGGLQYDNYVNKKVEGKPIGHFRISQGIRVSCVSENGTLRLRHFGSEPAVNANP